MKIGISIRLYTPESGGLQHHAAELVHQFRAKGHEVIIVTRAISRAPSYLDYFLFSEPADCSPERIDPGLRVLRHPRWLNPVLRFVQRCTGRKFLHAVGICLYETIYTRKMVVSLQGVDIVQHIGSGAEMIGFAAAAAARRLGVPFVVLPTMHPGQWGDTLFDSRLYRTADALLVHTRYEKYFLQRDGIEKPVTVVGAGIGGRRDGSGERFRVRVGIGGPIVLFVGRKSADKGYPLLIEAFQQVRARIGDATLVCIGPGETAPDTMPGVVDLGFADENTKHDALAACDVLCVPSEAEAFGLVYMEAARYRKAMIARRLPVLEELLGARNAAVLIGRPLADDNRVELGAEELGTAMIRLLADRAERDRLGRNAFAVSEGFLWSAVAERFTTVYEATVSRVR